MDKSIEPDNKHPSLENLIISENLGIETLHPGGLDITTELAELCNITKGVKVLELHQGLVKVLSIWLISLIVLVMALIILVT